MLKRYFLIIGIFSGMLFIVSCAGRTPYSEDSATNRNWGRSHQTAIYNQMLNPDAVQNLNPVLGLDGSAAENNVEKYKESFKEAEPKEIVNVLKLEQ
ncbi:MAG: hypothetical protein P8X68_01685 [Desulfobacterales bacterium]|jgi:hypothetical protein